MSSFIFKIVYVCHFSSSFAHYSLHIIMYFLVQKLKKKKRVNTNHANKCEYTTKVGAIDCKTGRSGNGSKWVTFGRGLNR